MQTSQAPAGDLELSILMPCLNEAETIESCIRKASNFITANNIRGEVVIGDNGSTDGSQEIARRNGARVVDVPIRGYGAAIFYGSERCLGRYIVVGDSDDSYDFSALQSFLTKLREGYGLVMGNRFLGGIRPGAMPWKNRYLGNPVLSAVGRLFFRCPAKDFHCGLRGYSRECFDRLDLRTTGMEFASEMVIKATLQGEKIAEVPTTLDPDGRSHPPHLRPWRDGWRHLRFMLLFSPRWLFLYPGLALMAVGSIGFAWLWPGDVLLGGVHLSIDTMLYAAIAIVTGYQAVTFSLFTKIFAIAEGLLPEDARLNWLFRYITLETGLIAGTMLMLMSIIGTILAVARWKSAGFGPIDATATLRIVIPSATGLLLGAQTILNSLFLSVLGLRTRKRAVPEGVIPGDGSTKHAA
jgi:glycosyltransferase involved in cell wall biosynthesis